MALPYIPKDEEEIENQSDDSLGVESGLAGVSKGISGQQLGSGQYTNLQKYLESNKGFGTDLANKVDSVVGSAERAQSDLDSQYRSDVDKSSVRLDQENIDFVTSNPYAAQQGYNKETLAKKMAEQTAQQTPQQTAQQPKQSSGSLGTMGLSAGPVLPGKTSPFVSKGTISSATTSEPSQQTPTAQTQQITQTANPFLDKIGDPTESRKFITQRDAVYSGPNQNNSESYFANPRTQTREAQQIGSLLGSESGKKQLLNKFYGGDKKTYGYTPGQQNLDLLLVSQDPSAKQSFLQAQQRASQLDPRFQNLITELSSYGRQKEQETSAARKAARDAIGIDDYGSYTGKGPIQNILNEIQKQKSDALTKYQTEVPQVSQALRNKDISKLTDEQKNKLNLQDIYSLYKVDPEKYLKLADINNLSDSSVTTEDQLRNITALSELANLQQSWVDPSKMGSYDANRPFTYDKQGLLSEIDKNRQNYITARKQLSAPLYYEQTAGLGQPTYAGQYYADIDDLIGVSQNMANSFQTGENTPESFGKYRSGSPYMFSYNPMGLMDASAPLNFLDYYKPMLFGPTGMDDLYGRTDVLKAGRAKEIGEIPDVIKKDIIEGFGSSMNPFMYKTRGEDLEPFDKLQSEMGSIRRGRNSNTLLPSAGNNAISYYYYQPSDQYFITPEEAARRGGTNKAMTWDEYFDLYSQGKFY